LGREIFLTLTVCNRIWVSVGRDALGTLSAPEQTNDESQKENFMAKKAKKADKKAPKKGK